MGLFCHMVTQMYIFYFAKQPKQDVLILCYFVKYLSNSPEELFSKQTFQNECGSSMECLHCA